MSHHFFSKITVSCPCRIYHKSDDFYFDIFDSDYLFHVMPVENQSLWPTNWYGVCYNMILYCRFALYCETKSLFLTITCNNIGASHASHLCTSTPVCPTCFQFIIPVYVVCRGQSQRVVQMNTRLTVLFTCIYVRHCLCNSAFVGIKVPVPSRATVCVWWTCGRT